MKNGIIAIVMAMAVCGCVDESSVNENSPEANVDSSISFEVTPAAGESLSVCDTIYIRFSSNVFTNADEYGNSSFTRYNGPINVVANLGHWSATYVPASYTYDSTTHLLKAYFDVASMSAATEMMNVGLSITPQYLHGENGEAVEAPSYNENGAYAIQYEYQEVSNCLEE